MKKTALLLSALAASTIVLAGCENKPNPSDFEQTPRTPSVQKQAADVEVDPPHRVMFGFPGVRRHFARSRSLAGEYTVEYIHSAENNVDLDCKLTVNEDNSYQMSFTKNGATVDHYGKWYSRRGSVTFYFDEEKPTYVPEVYYPDCITAEVIDGGKLMMYDGSSVIVLSHASAAENNG